MFPGGAGPEEAFLRADRSELVGLVGRSRRYARHRARLLAPASEDCNETARADDLPHGSKVGLRPFSRKVASRDARSHAGAGLDLERRHPLASSARWLGVRMRGATRGAAEPGAKNGEG